LARFLFTDDSMEESIQKEKENVLKGRIPYLQIDKIKNPLEYYDPIVELINYFFFDTIFESVSCQISKLPLEY